MAEPPGPSTTWVLPGEPVPVRLMNTIWADRTGVHDALSAPGALAAWLEESGLTGAVSVTDEDLARARRLRDALRRLAALRTGDRPGTTADSRNLEAVAEVNRSAASFPAVRRLRVDATGWHREENGSAGAAAALAKVAAEAIDLLTGDPDLLRTCRAPGCVLYFVRDHPRREWCSTACGNRARAARHYRRHHPGTGDPA